MAHRNTGARKYGDALPHFSFPVQGDKNLSTMAAREAKFRISKTSQVTEDKMAEFLAAPVSEDITSVPGIGPKAKELLAENGVETTHQLLGCFLRFKGADTSVQENCDQFYDFLRQCGIKSYVGAVTLCVAEKVNLMIPGTFDAAEVED